MGTVGGTVNDQVVANELGGSGECSKQVKWGSTFNGLVVGRMASANGTWLCVLERPPDEQAKDQGDSEQVVCHDEGMVQCACCVCTCGVSASVSASAALADERTQQDTYIPIASTFMYIDLMAFWS